MDASGAAGVFLTSSTFTGPVRVTGASGPVVVVNAKVTGPVELTNNRGGAPLVAANTVTGPLQCSGNANAPVNLELRNSVTGPKNGQCAGL